MKYEDKTFGFFCTYAPSRGLDTDFLLKVRRNQLNSTEDHTAIIGDLNCTVDRVLDKVGYDGDHHWRCREIKGVAGLGGPAGRVQTPQPRDTQLHLEG